MLYASFKKCKTKNNIYITNMYASIVVTAVIAQ